MSETLPLPKARDLFFTKQVTQDTISDITQKILEVNRSDMELERLYDYHGIGYTPAPIRLHIDSYGGSVYQCLGLIGIMDASITPIHTIVTGVAMSAGFMIAIHGSKRYAYKHATFMYHQLSSMAWGTLADMKDSVEESERLHKKLIELVIKKTKIPLKTLEENYERKKDWFMPVDEALSLGCIDALITDYSAVV